jgi:hypothetical protein
MRKCKALRTDERLGNCGGLHGLDTKGGGVMPWAPTS